MRRHGFALLVVLWILAVVSTGLALGLAGARGAVRAAANRVRLTRARWAAEACLAVAQGRWGTPRLRWADTLDLGRETRCAWRLDDLGARLDVNDADPELLTGLFKALGFPPRSADSLTARILAARSSTPLASVEWLGAPHGVLPFLTMEGPGTIDLATAPPELLASLPGLGAEAVSLIIQRRASGSPILSLDALLATLSSAGRRLALPHYADLAGLLSFAPTHVLLTATGWRGSAGSPPQATIELLVVAAGARLATLRRRMT